MKYSGGLARLALLAIGAGIGGAFASVSAVASADSSSDWLSAVDSVLGGGPLSAADTTPELNLAISFNGMSLFQAGDAHAYSGNSDIAIANGAGANAWAFGTTNYAYVDGTDSTAIAGAKTDAIAGASANNTAFVFGDNNMGYAGTTIGANPGSFNYAVIFGDGNTALAGGDASGAGSYDGAYVEGNNLATALARGADYLAAIVKFYGDGASTAAAADSTNPLGELLGGDPSGPLAEGADFWSSLLSGDAAGALASGQDFWSDLLGGSGALTDGANWWTDLLGALDVSGTAGDASNLWTELATLF